jgi:anti-anti-sigma factor
MSTVALRSEFALSGPVALIAFRGELELSTAPRAGDQLHALLEVGAREILVDLTETTFLDCAGMGALVEAADAAQARGGRLYVQRAHGQPRQLIEQATVRLKTSVQENVQGVRSPSAQPAHCPATDLG